MKILLPTTIDLSPLLPAGWESQHYTPDEPISDEHRDADALVTWGGSAGDMAALARELPGLRWVQALSAGTDAITSAGFPSDAIITSGRGLHDATVAEHALALMLAAVRSLPDCHRAKDEHRWASELGGLQRESDLEPLKSINGARILIWGFGSIGVTLARHLSGLGGQVTGIATVRGTREGFDVRSPDEVAQLLPYTDMLVMILPASPATHHALDASLIARMPARSWLINVGRGSTVDETVLAAALSEGKIAGAALDVFEQEPLSQDSPLWDLSNVIITPHSAGGRPRGASELIESNLHALDNGDPLINVVRHPNSR